MAGTRIEVRINGVAITSARFLGATIRETMGPGPNTGRLVLNAAPQVGSTIYFVATDESPDRFLFTGEIQAVTQTYDLQKRNPRYECQLVDGTFYANKNRPFGTYMAVSASTIATTIALQAPGLTTFGVAGSLPAVSLIFDGSDPFMTCWFRLVAAIGGVGGLSYLNDLSLALVDAGEAVDPVDLTHPPYNDPPVAISTDLSQVRTRIYGKGYTGTVVADVLSADTIVPIAAGDAVMFTSTGGSAILGLTAGAAQSLPVDYNGVQTGGGGSLVGPGASPGTAPALAFNGAGSLGTGVYQYAYTDITGAGESLPSPVASKSVGGAGIADPGTFTSTGVVIGSSATGSLTPGTHGLALSYISVDGETLPSTRVGGDGAYGVFAGVNQRYLLDVPAGPAGTIARRLWWTTSQTTTPNADSAQLYLAVTLHDNNPTTSTPLDISDATLITKELAPTANTTTGTAVLVSGVALGASGTTLRKIYRTAVNGSQLKLLTTIANNTATTYADTLADGSLGANVPTSDTSGLTQPSGQVNAGSTTLLLASAGPFQATGGWALLGGGQTVRYTGISGNTLTGIPASGTGAILTTVIYGSQATPSAALTGVVGLTDAIAKGSTVAIFIRRDDIDAQIALGILESGTDGIRVDHFFDGRMGFAELTAACDARLAQFSRPIVSVTYGCDDLKTRCGATVHIDLPGLVTAADFIIQDVTKTFVGRANGPIVKHAVRAASSTFTLRDLIRLAQLTVP